jgi:hypothetical protein
VPSRRASGNWQAKVRHKGRTYILGTWPNWEDARLSELEFQLSVLQDEQIELEAQRMNLAV